jgi:hypothetical protein
MIERKATVIGGGGSGSLRAQSSPSSAQTTVAAPQVKEAEATQLAGLPAAVPASFPVALGKEQVLVVEDNLAKVDFLTLTLQDVATLGNDAELALQQTLDGFLSRINQLDNPNLFKLVTQLNDAVAEQKLPDLADRILNGKPGTMDKLRSFLSKKGAEKALADAWEETKRLVQGKTKTLVDLVAVMEKELNQEQVRLGAEIRNMEELKAAYRDRFNDFVVVVAFLAALLERAKKQVAEAMAAANPADMIQKQDLDALQDKLQALESRTLALEGTLTRLPADHLVIRQLQAAGITTLQETTTTAASRFSSIKMTLLTINGAMITSGVQKLADKGAALDANLTAVRGKLMQDVVTKAANAPGDNRLAQAEQLKGIVESTQSLVGIVEQARTANQQKFTQARLMFDAARKDMLALGSKV